MGPLRLIRGRYAVRLAETEDDVRAAQKLRHDVFIAGREVASSETRSAGLDADDIDPLCDHVLIEERKSGQLICCFRLLPLENGEQIDRSYSARYYELSSLREFAVKLA
ncbi:MAG: GNAT family N-acetyltransferase, partial [Pseudomonadota bacterium]